MQHARHALLFTYKHRKVSFALKSKFKFCKNFNVEVNFTIYYFLLNFEIQ